MRIRYELAIIISYPTSASGIIILFKMLTKYWEFFPTWIVKKPIFSLFFNLSRRIQLPYLESIRFNGSYTMMARPIRALELHYPGIIQWFRFQKNSLVTSHQYFTILVTSKKTFLTSAIFMSRHDSNQSKIYLSTAKLYSDNKEQYFLIKI